MNNPHDPNQTDHVDRHTLAQSIALHMIPGLLIGAFYFATVRPITRLGFPSIAALIVSAVVVLIPLELGFLLIQAKKTGADGLAGIVRYRQPLPLTQYLIWVPVVFAASGVLITLATPVTTAIESWFRWIPDAFRLDMGLDGGYSRSVLIVTYFLDFLLVVLVAPTVEELYFRGYLLPRMPRLRGWAPVLHAALFALYHTWTPWMAVARTLALLPLIYVVRWKRNLYVGIIAHCLLNSLDVIAGVAFIVSLS
jgi:uncharacterized protein